MPELTTPSPDRYDAWSAAHAEWGPGRHEDGFGLRPTDEVDTPAGFATWVRRLRDHADPSVPLAPGGVPTTYWWIVEGDVVLGGIALRHRLGERQQDLGHVGYGIRPAARRRGLATWALREVLDVARTVHGLERVRVVCDAGNAASAAVIERCGGVLEDVRDSAHGRIRRYDVPLVGPPPAGLEDGPAAKL